MNLSLGDKIRFLRMQLNMSQFELAELVNVMPSAISKYESGRVNVSADMLVKISNVLHTTPDFLLGFSDDSSNNLLQYSSEDIDLLNLISKLSKNQKSEVKGYINGLLSK